MPNTIDIARRVTQRIPLEEDLLVLDRTLKPGEPIRVLPFQYALLLGRAQTAMGPGYVPHPNDKLTVYGRPVMAAQVES